MDAAHSGGLGGTYGGNPISIAAAHAVLDVVESENLCGRAARVGSRMRTHLENLARQYPGIGDVRGLGAMVAFELVKDAKTKEPDPDLTTSIQVHGLSSFGAITSFKQSLERVEGIRSVTLGLGPTGEFIYTATHAPAFDLDAAIRAIEGEGVHIERDNGTLRVRVGKAARTR